MNLTSGFSFSQCCSGNVAVNTNLCCYAPGQVPCAGGVETVMPELCCSGAIAQLAVGYVQSQQVCCFPDGTEPLGFNPALCCSEGARIDLLGRCTPPPCTPSGLMLPGGVTPPNPAQCCSGDFVFGTSSNTEPQCCYPNGAIPCASTAPSHHRRSRSLLYVPAPAPSNPNLCCNANQLPNGGQTVTPPGQPEPLCCFPPFTTPTEDDADFCCGGLEANGSSTPGSTTSPGFGFGAGPIDGFPGANVCCLEPKSVITPTQGYDSMQPPGTRGGAPGCCSGAANALAETENGVCCLSTFVNSADSPDGAGDCCSGSTTSPSNTAGVSQPGYPGANVCCETPGSTASDVSVSVPPGQLGSAPSCCSGAAKLPPHARRLLWQETATCCLPTFVNSADSPNGAGDCCSGSTTTPSTGTTVGHFIPGFPGQDVCCNAVGTVVPQPVIPRLFGNATSCCSGAASTKGGSTTALCCLPAFYNYASLPGQSPTACCSGDTVSAGYPFQAYPGHGVCCLNPTELYTVLGGGSTSACCSGVGNAATGQCCLPPGTSIPPSIFGPSACCSGTASGHVCN